MPGPLDDDLTRGPATPSGAGPARALGSVAARTPGTPGTSAGRFTPGVIIAGRYRLVALLGRGGMGEVYRADDLTLDQTVALKFLPDDIAEDALNAEQLARFHGELRIARQVSHKNVCRLYDLGEANGRRFLTMEYVDGEDLGALLRRIGRFPQDRAIAIARQLCAGVAAAHERGVIHRDLKPANVMIDGDGDVRVTDFGIATATADARPGITGTPQYMAPEQWTGSAASIKTDIYAVGLILFEIFTGKPAHDAKTLRDLKALHDTGTVPTPSSIIRDLDPAVERVILRCLERDPARRPLSVLAIAAALPGGDPLAAALAAGETPSPDVLAAAAETEATPVLHGLSLVGVLAACIMAYVAVSPRATTAGLVPLEKAPAVLADRAQQILADFGYAESPADVAESFMLARDFPRWLVETDHTTNRWNRARMAIGPALLYWYRTGPRDLAPASPLPRVSPTDPPLSTSGMSLIMLDTRGRLQEFHRVPPVRDAPQPSGGIAPRWNAVFQALALPMATFTPVEPEWTPQEFADARAAWEGPLPDAPAIRVRVEAASYRGDIVSVRVIGPWSLAERGPASTQSILKRALSAFGILFSLTTLAGSALLARHNMRAGRADRRSAARLATLYLGIQVTAWLISGHHSSEIVAEGQSLFGILAIGVFNASLLWVLYLAVEPYGRRFWPDGLLGWTRMFSGHLRDPRIGREILIGAALGGVLMLFDTARALSPYLIGRPPGIPALGFDVATLVGPSRMAVSWMQQFYNSVQSALIITMLFVVLRLLVRRTWIAITIGLVVVSALAGQNMPPGGVLWLDATAQVGAIGLITFGIFRYGLLVTTVMLIVDNIPTAVPVVARASSWAATPGNASIALVLAIACFGFYAARAGQPLFGSFGDEAR